MAKKKQDTPRSFTHDSNARNSAKLIKLRMAHGAAGYGVYFMLLERLRDAPDYQEAIDYDVLAYDLREDRELIRSVIEDFDLFIISDDKTRFHSATLTKRLSAQFVTSQPESQPEPQPEQPAEPQQEEEPTEPSGPMSFREAFYHLKKDTGWLEDYPRRFGCNLDYFKNMLQNFRNEHRHDTHRYASPDELRDAYTQWVIQKSGF